MSFLYRPWAAPAFAEPPKSGSAETSAKAAKEDRALEKGKMFLTQVQRTDGAPPELKDQAKAVAENVANAKNQEDAVDAMRSGLHEFVKMLASSKMEKVSSQDKRNEVRNKAADISNGLGQYQDGVALSEAVLGESRDNRDALGHLAQGHYGLGNYDAAIRFATRHAEVDPTNDESYTTRALAYYAQGNYLQAQEDAQRALALNKNNETAFATLRMAETRIHPLTLHLNAEQLAQADQVRHDYETMVHQSNQVESLGASAASAAGAKFKVKDYWGTISESSRAIELNPKDGHAYYFRAAAGNMLGRYQQAVEDAAMAIALEPDSAAAYDARATALNRLQRPREALADSMQSIALSPNNAYAYANRAESHEKLGDFQSMLADYRRASRLNPQFEPAYKKAAKVHALAIALLPDPAAPSAQDTTAPWKNRRFLLILASGIFGLLLIAVGCMHVLSPGPIGPAGSKIPAGYELVRPIGEGGMGIVYEAVDLALGRRVAIKKIKEAKNGQFKNSGGVLDEARTVAALRHPNIVEIHSVVEHDGNVYLVFELVPGRPLSQILARQGSLSLAQARRIVRDICGGLEYAHRHGIIHRDLKPSNIMITEEGRVKIMDFGVAKHFESRRAETSTLTVVGTPPYMAPEAEQGIVRKQSDIFALGACLFEMLAGKRPYPDTASAALKLTRGYVKLSWQNAALPPALDDLIDDALHPDPDLRIRSAEEFLSRLDQIADPAAV